MIKKLKSPFHSNHAEHSADFICEIVDEKRVLRKAIKAKDEEIELLKAKAFRAGAVAGEQINKNTKLQTEIDQSIAARDKTIEAQAKEIAELKKEVERLQCSLSGLNDDKERRINQDWDNYQPSPRNMG